MLSFQEPRFECQRPKSPERNYNALVISLYSALMIILSFFLVSYSVIEQVFTNNLVYA